MADEKIRPSCSIGSGIERHCKTLQGGISKIYIFPFVEYSRTQINFVGQSIIDFPSRTVFEIDATGMSYSETSSVDKGNIEWSQTVSFKVPETTSSSEIYKLLNKDYFVITLDNIGNYRIIGLWNGAESSIQDGSGSSKSEMNGYSVTIKAKEDNQAYYIDDFESIFTPHTKGGYVFNPYTNAVENYLFQDGNNYIFNN